MFMYVNEHKQVDDLLVVWRDQTMLGLIRSRQGILSYYPRDSRIPSINASSLGDIKRMIEVVERQVDPK